jgi:choline dehydrogenase-like flavoprotein
MAEQTEKEIGIEFTETMRGFCSTEVTDDYQRAFKQGQHSGSPFEFTVTVVADHLDRMLADPNHEAQLSGSVTAPALSPQPLSVRDGRFHLFVKDPDRPMTRKMVYEMPMATVDGRRYFLSGFKTIHDDPGPDMWADTTTLFITVHEGDDAEGTVIAKGIVTIHIKDFKRQMASMKVLNTSDRCEQLRALSQFGQFFSGVLHEIYGGIFARSSVFNPDAPPRERRALRCGDPEIHVFEASDGVRLKLTRYEGGTKGPVILSPGFGTSALAFTIDTTETNLPEYLFEHGYDVWVFDYRASPDLPSASTQFSLDDIATKDYPAAVNHVREVTGAETVQVMAHCVGSLTLMMSLATGLENVRSAVCSQLTFHPVAPPLNKIKAGLYLANFLTVMGFETLSTEFDTKSNWTDHLYDALLRLYPSKEQCNSPVCRRILFMYGEVYDHNQLNDATHEALHEMFGVANLKTFKHITTILQAGHAVTADGKEEYLPNVERLRMPIALLHGANNRLFLPEGSKATYEFLCEKNGPDHYVRHVIPGYAHMDCFIGKNASRDVYPIVLQELDKHNIA